MIKYIKYYEPCFWINFKLLTVTTVRSTRFLDTSLLSGTIGLLTVVVVVNKSLIGCTTKNWATNN